jgi:hypothetical protein
VLNKLHTFFQFHLIENFGCDFAATGLSNDVLVAKLKAFFFKRRQVDSSFYSTYVLYYCGPTSPTSDNLALSDGSELSIEKIVGYWKEIHCIKEQFQQQQQQQHSAEGSASSKVQFKHGTSISSTPPSTSSNKSRLVIILDAEHTNKSVQFINTHLHEHNVYVALQTVKYTLNTNEPKMSM